MTIVINNMDKYRELFNAGIGFITGGEFYSKNDCEGNTETRFIPTNENWDY